MARLLLVALLFGSSPVYAGDFNWGQFLVDIIFGTKSSGSGGSGGGGGGRALKRYVLGGGAGQLREFPENTINDEDTEVESNFFYQADTGIGKNRVAWVHAEISYMAPRARATWEGTPGTDIEMTVLGGHLGLLIQIPMPAVRPFFGGGYYAGHSVIFNPATSLSHGFGRLSAKENKFIQGPTAFGGLDIGSEKFGLRTQFDYMWLHSDKYSVLQQRRLQFEFARVGAGLYFSF